MAFFGPLFDSKTSIWGTLGGHFGTLWLHFGGLGLPGDTRGDPLGSKVDFWWILGALGGSFGVHFLNFCVFLVSKVAVGLQTCFLSGFDVEK